MKPSSFRGKIDRFHGRITFVLSCPVLNKVSHINHYSTCWMSGAEDKNIALLVDHCLDESRSRSPSSPPLSLCKQIPRNKLINCQFRQLVDGDWEAIYANSDDEFEVYTISKPKPKIISLIKTEAKKQCEHDSMERDSNADYNCLECGKRLSAAQCNHDSLGIKQDPIVSKHLYTCSKCNQEWSTM